MKQIIILLLAFAINAFGSRESDSLALVALKEANRENSLPWDYGEPIDHWSGVNVYQDRVETLYLPYYGISILPPEIGNLTELHNLNIYGEPLHNIPKEFGNLSKLNTLDFYCDSNTNFLSDFRSQSNLKELAIVISDSSAVPIEVFNLQSLSRLHLNGGFAEIPEEIRNLSKLRKLEIFNASLSSLPKSIGSLTELIYLRIENSALKNLPAEIANLEELVSLYLNSNSLSHLPPEIGNLLNLKILYANNNKISSLPKEIGMLSKLEGLELSNNILSSLPVEIGNMNSLSGISLAGNQLSDLPSEIRHCTNINFINLDDNSFYSLPDEITELSPTRYLSVAANNLIESNMSEGVVSWLDNFASNWRNSQREEVPIASAKTPIHSFSSPTVAVTANSLHLSHPTAKTARVTIINFRGQQLVTRSVNLTNGRGSVNLSGIGTTGIYMAKIETEGRTFVQKFAVER